MRTYMELDHTQVEVDVIGDGTHEYRVVILRIAGQQRLLMTIEETATLGRALLDAATLAMEQERARSGEGS